MLFMAKISAHFLSTCPYQFEISYLGSNMVITTDTTTPQLIYIQDYW